MKKRYEYYKVPKSYIRQNIRKQLQAEWDQQYEEYNGYIKNTLEHAEKIATIGINPHFVTFLTEHGTVKSYQHRFKIVDNLLCNFCGKEEETAKHLIFNSEQMEHRSNDNGGSATKIDSQDWRK